MHRSSFLKKIVAIVAIWWVIQVFFWLLGVDSVAAATLSDYVQDKIHIYNSILNAVYLLVRPALALAGFALDNSMVYGSLFGLDAPLFLIWNIIKNIANFILWFMVLFEILKNFFTTGESGKKAFEVIKKALIAWVLIQASWFLMGAIIDISTIATYSVGGIPITILWWDDNQCQALANIKTLPVGSKVNFKTSSENSSINNGFQYYYYVNNNGTKTYFSPCSLYKDRWVIGPQFWWVVDWIDYKDTENYCILPGNKFAYFGEGAGNLLATNQTVLTPLNKQQPAPGDYLTYKQNLNEILNHETLGIQNPEKLSGWVNSKLVFDDRTWAKSQFVVQEKWIYLLNGTGAAADVFAWAPMLKDIIAKAEWFVGVLITLYKSVLNFVSFNTGSSDTDTFILFLEVLLKVWFGLALLIPLLILAVALVIRVWYIWMFIALSPIIALKIAFDDNDTMKNIWSWIPILKSKMSDIIRIIFAPVLITFAVSFCLVFMTALITSINNQSDNTPSACLGNHFKTFEAMGTQAGNATSADANKTYQIAGIAEVQQSAFGSSVTGPQRDIFGWVLINLFGIAIIWLLLMATIDAVFKDTPIGKLDLWSKALKMLTQVPIIPIPNSTGWFSGVWVGTLARVAESKVLDISKDLDDAQTDALLWKNKPDKTWEKWSTAGTTNANSTATTINTIGAANTGTIAAAVAKWWLGSGVDMSTVAALKDNVEAKKLTANDISKSIVTDTDFYTKYKFEVDKLDSTKKTERLAKDAQWINTNKNIFNQEEFKSILQRNDDLAKRLAPQQDISKIKLGWTEWILEFKLWSDGLWQYEFTSVTDANKSSPDYTPLIDKSSITDWSANLETLRK